MIILVEKSFFHFIRKIYVFCGGNFLKRSLVRGPLEAYIFIFWKCWKQPILRTSHPGSHSIKQVNWTAILAVINQTSKLDSHPGCHSIKPGNWIAILAVTQSTATAAATAAVSQELWNLGGALVQRAQEPNIPCGESLTSTKSGKFLGCRRHLNI